MRRASDQSQRELQFTIKGQVIQLAMPDVPSFQLSRMSRNERKQLELNVLAFRDPDLEIISHEFRDAELAKFFTVTTEPLPKEKWTDPLITSATHVTLNIQPGLPIGVLQQVLRLVTNKRDVPPIEIYIDMSVISDISVLAPGQQFNAETNTLVLGPVAKSTGRAGVKLFVIAKGAFKDDVKLQVVSIDPAEAIAVELGEPSGQEKVRRFPVTLNILPGSPSVNRMGSEQGEPGKIVLSTQHPELPQLEMRVNFVIHD